MEVFWESEDFAGNRKTWEIFGETGSNEVTNQTLPIVMV